MEGAINKMKARQTMLANSARVCSYCYYCVKMMWENGEDEMERDRRHSVDHEEMEVVAVERNWLDSLVVRKAFHC